MRGNWVSELPTEAFIPDKLKTALCPESDEAAGTVFLDLIDDSSFERYIESVGYNFHPFIDLTEYLGESL